MKKQEELYSFPQQNDGAVVETDIRMIPLSELHDFNGHPFKVENDMALFELMQSIEKEGVIVPALVRTKADGGYELIAGHRRKAACKWAGLNCMPVVVRDLDDNQAVIAMVDSNLQREHLKPSEKAFAYKMKLEAMKRQGARTDLTFCQVGEKLSSSQVVTGTSNQVGSKLEKAEAAAREDAIRKKKQLEEERKQEEIRSRKRKLAYERNNIQHEYYSAELERPDWNREYIEYLDTQFIRDATSLSEEELTGPILTREEFEKEQTIVLYREKADKAGNLWDKALSELSSITHNRKWEYMDYLEEVRFKDLSNVTLREAKEKILSYEEFAELKEAVKEIQEQTSDIVEVSKIVAIQTDSIDEPQATVVSEETSVEILEIEEIKSEDTEVISEIIDYTKLSIEERALLLPVPTDDYKAEYNAYCQRMGYTEEKVSSIRYKMSLYDEFMEEYEYRKKYFGVEEVRTKEEQKKVIKER